MNLIFVCAPGCRVPGGARAALAAVATDLTPRRLPVQVVVGRDALLRRLNRQFRGRDRATDVLSFRYDAGSETALDGEPGGEIYVSLDRARVQARQQGHALGSEFVLLVVHGILHVQGHDHHTAPESRRMRAAEVRVLRRVTAHWPRLAAAPMLPPPPRVRNEPPCL